MPRAEWKVATTWDGQPVSLQEEVALSLDWDEERAELRVDAPFHDDPPPFGPPGVKPGLWEYEVVELFLVGLDQRYLEIEIGPHGHHLVLELHGCRHAIREGLALALDVQREGNRWQATAGFPAAWLPAGLFAANAFAIHGEGRARRFLAASALPGPAPDFHQIACFPPLLLS
ncbi:MAG: hypothetical protein JRH01_11190 [Deltaproteobacteria bacterium]|nr:hypothetical protein [Deltaproteobacteria bacterium]MBW2394550.1 hypothetical protein [Deltaproteobacteria bacterium]